MKHTLITAAVLAAALAAPLVASAQDKTVITPEQIAAGAKLYAANCSVCHGVDMVETGGGFFDLRTFPTNQRARFMNSVSNGKNSMPPWRSVLTQEEIGNLFAYVVGARN